MCLNLVLTVVYMLESGPDCLVCAMFVLTVLYAPQVQDPRGEDWGQISLTKYLYVNHAGSRKTYPISLISNKRFEVRF